MRLLNSPTTITALFASIASSLQLVFRYLLSVRFFHRKPRVVYFSPSEQVLIKGGILKLEWKVKRAAFVHVSGLGYFGNAGETALPIHFDKASFTITVYGFLKRSRLTIELSAMEKPSLDNTVPKLQIALIAGTNTAFRIKPFQLAARRSKWALTNKHLSVTQFIQ
jgi:hypothetical protein